MQQLSLATRPKTLDQLIGQEKIVKNIRGLWTTDRKPKAWLFSGPKGTGKTSTSRILALAYQCLHQEKFGTPCLDCRKRKGSFQIFEINASQITTKDSVEEALTGAYYGVMGGSQYRVYILDEVHRFSDAAQNLLLKYTEDTPDTTVFILASTAPQKILETLRSRCVWYEMRDLGQDDISKLVVRVLKYAKSPLPADRLVDALVDRGIASPRLVVQAVEKYVAGADPEDAVQVEGATELDVSALTKAVVKGDWEAARIFLLKTQGTDIRPVRLGVLAYLKAVLLNSDIDERGRAVATAIGKLALVQNAEDLVVGASVTAELYQLCSIFAKYSL